MPSFCNGTSALNRGYGVRNIATGAAADSHTAFEMVYSIMAASYSGRSRSGARTPRARGSLLKYRKRTSGRFALVHQPASASRRRDRRSPGEWRAIPTTRIGTRTRRTQKSTSPNPDLALKPRMYAQASICLARRNRVLALPTQAVSSNVGQPNVWIVNANDRVEQSNVTIGLQTANWIQVTDRLKPGDRLLVGDRSALSVGEQVRPKPANLANL